MSPHVNNRVNPDHKVMHRVLELLTSVSWIHLTSVSWIHAVLVTALDLLPRLHGTVSLHLPHVSSLLLLEQILFFLALSWLPLLVSHSLLCLPPKPQFLVLRGAGRAQIRKNS